MLSITKKLTENGFRVVTPCLAGHGGTVEDLADSTWEDWYETVLKAYTQLSKEVDKVYYVGMSVGSLLGLKLASEVDEGIRALALMSTPLQLPFYNRFLLPLIKNSPLKYVLKSVAKNFRDSVADPEGLRLYMQQSLPRMPIAAALQLLELEAEVKKNLHKVKNPLLLLHSKLDIVAPYSNVKLIKKLAGSDVIETATFSDSRHILTLDIERHLAANAALQFFRRFF